jgi:glutaredoxin
MITIYGKKPCPYCDEARNLAMDLGETINYKDVIKQLGYNSLADFFDKTQLKIPETHRSVPVIFKNGEYVGGYTELLELVKNQELEFEDF